MKKFKKGDRVKRVSNFYSSGIMTRGNKVFIVKSCEVGNRLYLEGSPLDWNIRYFKLCDPPTLKRI